MNKYKIRIEVEAHTREEAIKSFNATLAKTGVDPFVEPFNDSEQDKKYGIA